MERAAFDLQTGKRILASVSEAEKAYKNKIVQYPTVRIPSSPGVRLFQTCKPQGSSDYAQTFLSWTNPGFGVQKHLFNIRGGTYNASGETFSIGNWVPNDEYYMVQSINNHYIPEGQLISCFQHNGYWLTDYRLPPMIFCNLTQELGSGGYATATTIGNQGIDWNAIYTNELYVNDRFNIGVISSGTRVSAVLNRMATYWAYSVIATAACPVSEA